MAELEIKLFGTPAFQERIARYLAAWEKRPQWIMIDGLKCIPVGYTADTRFGLGEWRFRFEIIPPLIP